MGVALTRLVIDGGVIDCLPSAHGQPFHDLGNRWDCGYEFMEKSRSLCIDSLAQQYLVSETNYFFI